MGKDSMYHKAMREAMIDPETFRRNVSDLVREGRTESFWITAWSVRVDEDGDVFISDGRHGDDSECGGTVQTQVVVKDRKVSVYVPKGDFTDISHGSGSGMYLVDEFKIVDRAHPQGWY